MAELRARAPQEEEKGKQLEELSHIGGRDDHRTAHHDLPKGRSRVAPPGFLDAPRQVNEQVDDVIGKSHQQQDARGTMNPARDGQVSEVGNQGPRPVGIREFHGHASNDQQCEEDHQAPVLDALVRIHAHQLLSRLRNSLQFPCGSAQLMVVGVMPTDDDGKELKNDEQKIDDHHAGRQQNEHRCQVVLRRSYLRVKIQMHRRRGHGRRSAGMAVGRAAGGDQARGIDGGFSVVRADHKVNVTHLRSVTIYAGGRFGAAQQTGFPVEAVQVAGDGVVASELRDDLRVAMADRTCLSERSNCSGRLQAAQDVLPKIGGIERQRLPVAGVTTCFGFATAHVNQVGYGVPEHRFVMAVKTS